jgi:hypothetical protein
LSAWLVGAVTKEEDMCECVTRIQTEMKEKCQGQFRKPIASVACAGLVLSFNDGRTRSTTTFNVELEGQKKLESVKITHSYCPWCGEKQ